MDRCLTLQECERRAAGELSAPEQERFDRHIAECEECRQAYQHAANDNRFLRKMKSVLGRRETEVGGGTPTRMATSAPSESSPRKYLPRIEGYVIRNVLGRGGMGVVYEAVQAKLNRTVALKLLPAIVSSSHPQTIERFHREAEAAARLHHRNIISIYDFGESPDGYYYAMELIEGQPISTLIKRLAADPARHDTEDSIAALLTAPGSGPGPATPGGVGSADAIAAPAPPSTAEGRFFYTQVAHWIAQVADALHYAHLNGLIHRDVKPSNLMLATDGRILILDFGLVKASGDESVTMSGSLIGTYRYMSPEQLGAKRIPVDARTDIYSLGATLYELLSLQPAFRSSERPQLLSEVMFREPTLPHKIIPSVPLELENICLKAMEKAPAARYQSAGMMAEDLRRYINDLPIIARRQGPLRRGYKFLRRHRDHTIATTVIVLLAGIATLIIYSREAEVRRQEIEVLNSLLKKGAADMRSESWDEAEEAFAELLTLGPPRVFRVKALLNLAIINKDRYYQEGQPEFLNAARTYVDRAFEIGVDPKRRAALNIKGTILRSQRDFDAAEAALLEARKTEDDPAVRYGELPILSNLGSVYALKKNLGEAERYLLEAIRKKTKDDSVSQESYNLAVVQIHLGQRQPLEVLETLKTAWKWSRKYGKDSLLNRPEIKLLEAKLHLTLREHYDALKAAIAADENSDADDPRAVIKRYLALAELRDRRWHQAVGSAEQALSLEDKLANLDVERTYAYLILAIARAHLEDVTMARDDLKKALVTWPQSLRRSGDFVVTERDWMIWIDSADDLMALCAEAEELVGSAGDCP